MNRVINGKRYNTDTAEEMGYTSYGSGPRDFHHWSETLFRKQTGEFFVYGEGGPLSKYAETVGQNEWSGGEKIMPVSLEAAQKWAEEYLDADEYEKIFGAVEETDEKRTVTFSLSEKAIEEIARMAASEGISKSEVIERLVRRG